jgi:hypothetical protein
MIGLKPAGIGLGRTKSLPSSLAHINQSQENAFRAIRTDLVTGDGNGVSVLLTADGGIIAVLNVE